MKLTNVIAVVLFLNCWMISGNAATTNEANLIALGFKHTCVIDDNKLRCWGDNSYNQLTIPSLNNPSKVTSGSNHSCAIADGGVKCWGENNNRETEVPKMNTPSFLSSGFHHNCVIVQDEIKCWGSKDFLKYSPPSMKNLIALSSGSDFSCAIDNSNIIKCWGLNDEGQLDVPQLINPRKLTSGSAHSCVIDKRQVKCWGSNRFGQLNVPKLTNPKEVTAGGFHTCALDDNGISCWGENDRNQLSISKINEPRKIIAGNSHTCAIGEDGFKCWGWNENGQANAPQLKILGENFFPLFEDSDKIETKLEESERLENIYFEQIRYLENKTSIKDFIKKLQSGRLYPFYVKTGWNLIRTSKLSGYAMAIVEHRLKVNPLGDEKESLLALELILKMGLDPNLDHDQHWIYSSASYMIPEAAKNCNLPTLKLFEKYGGTIGYNPSFGRGIWNFSFNAFYEHKDRSENQNKCNTALEFLISKTTTYSSNDIINVFKDPEDNFYNQGHGVNEYFPQIINDLILNKWNINPSKKPKSQEPEQIFSPRVLPHNQWDENQKQNWYNYIKTWEELNPVQKEWSCYYSSLDEAYEGYVNFLNADPRKMEIDPIVLEKIIPYCESIKYY